MRLDLKAAGLLIVAAGVIAAGVYVFDAKQSKRVGDVAATPMAAPAEATIPVPHPALPPSHPAVAGASPQAPSKTAVSVLGQKLPASHPPVAVAPPGANAREGAVTLDTTRAFTHFRVGNNSVVAIYPDGPFIWLGGSGGMVRYNTATREFKTYLTRDGLRSNAILYLGKLRGKILIGTYGGGLSLLNQDAQEWEHYGVAEGLSDAVVFDVLEASSADVWIATGSGVNRVRGGALKERAKWDLHTVENTAGGLPHDRVYRIVEGKGGSVWFATRGGVANYRNGKWKNWRHLKGPHAPREGASPDAASNRDPMLGQVQEKKQPPEAPGADTKVAFKPAHVAALAVGKDGAIWAGTRGAGLARFDGKAWTNYTVAEGLPSNQIYALHIDRKGRLWIGTENGLAVFDNGKFQVMTTAQGLLAENVYSVTTTKDGGVWAGSFGGVAHIRQPAFEQHIHLPPAPNAASPTASRSK